MIVKVKYYNEKLGAYSGMDYTYTTKLSLRKNVAVLVPVGNDGEKKRAIVTAVDLPSETIKPEWADRVKEIKEFYKANGSK